LPWSYKKVPILTRGLALAQDFALVIAGVDLFSGYGGPDCPSDIYLYGSFPPSWTKLHPFP